MHSPVVCKQLHNHLKHCTALTNNIVMMLEPVDTASSPCSEERFFSRNDRKRVVVRTLVYRIVWFLNNDVNCCN
jgi:hypothetical protein